MAVFIRSLLLWISAPELLHCNESGGSPLSPSNVSLHTYGLVVVVVLDDVEVLVLVEVDVVELVVDAVAVVEVVEVLVEVVVVVVDVEVDVLEEVELEVEAVVEVVVLVVVVEVLVELVVPPAVYVISTSISEIYPSNEPDVSCILTSKLAS